MKISYIPVTCIYPNGMQVHWKYIRRLEQDHENYYVWMADHLEPEVYSKENFKLIAGRI